MTGMLRKEKEVAITYNLHRQALFKKIPDHKGTVLPNRITAIKQAVNSDGRMEVIPEDEYPDGIPRYTLRFCRFFFELCGVQVAVDAYEYLTGFSVRSIKKISGV